MEKSITFEGRYARIRTHQEGAGMELLSEDTGSTTASFTFTPHNSEAAHEMAKCFGILRRRMLGLANHFERLEAVE